MRKIEFLENEYYLVKNFGLPGSKIFIDKEDKIRFMFLLLFLQSPITINNTNWYVSSFIKKDRFSLSKDRIKEIIENRHLELISFGIEENGFEIIVKNLDKYILSVYMQRILTGYARYFNSKYNRRGHVFQGPFQAEKIKRVDLRKSIENMNKKYRNNYRYSSAGDYAERGKKNRWQDLLRVI